MSFPDFSDRGGPSPAKAWAQGGRIGPRPSSTRGRGRPRKILSPEEKKLIRKVQLARDAGMTWAEMCRRFRIYENFIRKYTSPPHQPFLGDLPRWNE